MLEPVDAEVGTLTARHTDRRDTDGRRLVMIGVRADGRKELVALADGYRDAPARWSPSETASMVLPGV